MIYLLLQLKLVEKLLKAEKEAKVASPINCYRKLLVCDVLPLVLTRLTLTESLQKTVLKWLQLSIEFYVLFVTQTSGAPTSPGII